ncbi:MAG: phosphate ABC transporter membrane protein [Candidatus Saganbacteria bacterium]|uniref:Phosphate transport system permease protein n=1 Tax=Candidatus Saganbacteria bacterium TaxID=2575572 RepID=A0A833L0H5_UNCSA|nr:MAG: phosphate ABC transporter membrane protein [Candidatus Saganbacteria bacterium]
MFALSIPLLLLLLVVILVGQALPSINIFGAGFIFSSSWDPVRETFGALPYIYGTLVSSLIALIIAVPLGLGSALYLAEVSRSKIKEYLAVMIELLAAIPSIIYGLWGIFVLGPLFGLSMLSGGVILAIMILPTIAAISREVFRSVPNIFKESAMALGATRWETIKLAVFGPARSGILGAIILGLGRALGETMAVTMVIGNRPEISASIFAPAYTLASVIANEFAEASSDVYLSALVELGIILLLITMVVNGLARLLIWKTVGKNNIF